MLSDKIKIKYALKNYLCDRFPCFLILHKYFKNSRKIYLFAAGMFYIIIFISTLLFPLFIYPGVIYCDDWLKVDASQNEKIWIDTSGWETKSVYIKDGYYKNVEKERWVDTSYTVSQGHWKTGEYKVWIDSRTTVPYTAYRYVDTSHWETTYKYVEVQKPVYFSKIFGTDSYGWSVYSFASKYQGMKQIIYNGEKYLVHVYVIDYRPARGGQVYAVKYVFVFQFVKEKRTSTKWVTSGYWQGYTAYKTVDTSHWETRTGRYWVDTSYTVAGGYWETYTERQWVDTGYYENRKVWVNSGYYTSPLHGKVTVEKNPEYIFTKWHKDSKGIDCGMDLKVSWEIDNTLIPEGETDKKITGAHVYQETIRYKDRGVEKTSIYNNHVTPSAKGFIETYSEFEYAGNNESILHIYLYAGSGESVHVYFSNPVNGFKSININYGGTGTHPDSFAGGNFYGEVVF